MAAEHTTKKTNNNNKFTRVFEGRCHLASILAALDSPERLDYLDSLQSCWLEPPIAHAATGISARCHGPGPYVCGPIAAVALHGPC